MFLITYFNLEETRSWIQNRLWCYLRHRKAIPLRHAIQQEESCWHLLFVTGIKIQNNTKSQSDDFMATNPIFGTILLFVSYGWIALQLGIVTTLTFLLSRSDFKSKTSFGSPRANYTGQSVCFFEKPQNGLFVFFVSILSSVFKGFQGVLGTVLAIWAQIEVLASWARITSVNKARLVNTT